MKRFLISPDEIIFGQSEAVVEIPQEEVGAWALEVSLLLLGFSESLTVRHQRNGGSLLLSLQADDQAKRAVISHSGANKASFSLARTQMGYLQAVLLRAYRDGQADVEHIHLEGTAQGRGHDLTLFFGASRPPMSAEEAARRMRD